MLLSPVTTVGRRASRTAIALAAVVSAVTLALVAVVVHQPTRTAPSAASPTAGVPSPAQPSPRATHGPRHELLGLAGGALPSGATIFDDYPGVTRLNPTLLAALRDAADDARRDGVGLVVNSGWRSVSYQEQLLDQAIRRYGSAAAASRWVASPDTSAHVSGDAVDVGPARAQTWLAAHGAAYALCRVYDNEPWHFELRAGAERGGCPVPYADAAHDPRLRR